MVMNIENPRKYRIIVIALIVVNLLIIGSWWYLNNSNDPTGENNKRRERKGMNRDFFEKTLQLDEQQRKEFKQLNQAHFNQIGSLNKEIDSLKILIRDEVLNTKPDEKRIQQLFNEIALKRTMVDTSFYHHFRRMKSVCRPEQFPAFDSLTNSFFMKREHSKGQP